MTDYIQPSDDLVQIEQELQESIQEYVVVCKDNNRSAPVYYVNVKATSETDAFKEAKKIVPSSVILLKSYPVK